MALQPDDTTAWLSVFRQNLDEMFSHFFDRSAQEGGCFEFSPQLDIYETADLFVIEIDLPGFSENDFTVGVTESNIRIEGIKRQEKPDGPSRSSTRTEVTSRWSVTPSPFTGRPGSLV